MPSGNFDCGRGDEQADFVRFCRRQGVWSRALGLPIERPKSMTMTWIEEHVK